MRISDWSSDVCSSDLVWKGEICNRAKDGTLHWVDTTLVPVIDDATGQIERYLAIRFDVSEKRQLLHSLQWRVGHDVLTGLPNRTYLSDLLDQALEFSRAQNLPLARSEEHTSELQSLMRISYAVFCLKKNKEITI